jgi:hypothetical protein
VTTDSPATLLPRNTSSNTMLEAVALTWLTSMKTPPPFPVRVEKRSQPTTWLQPTWRAKVTWREVGAGKSPLITRGFRISCHADSRTWVRVVGDDTATKQDGEIGRRCWGKLLLNQSYSSCKHHHRRVNNLDDTAAADHKLSNLVSCSQQ